MKLPKWFRGFYLSVTLFPASLPCFAEERISLEQLFSIAEERSQSIRSVQQSIDSLEAEIRARDLELSPQLVGEAAIVRDELEQLDRRQRDVEFEDDSGGTYGFFDATLVKPFDTGTELALSAGHNVRDAGGLNRERNVADWELRLSQSLWRNRFGRATDLRRRGEAFELRARRFEALTERQRIFQGIENAYWDLALARTEAKIRQANIERSVALEDWTQERVDRFAAEEVDLLQVRTLLSERQLDLTIAKNAIETASNTLRQFLPNVTPTTWEVDPRSLEIDRELSALLLKGVASSPPEPMRIDALVAVYRAQQSRFEAERIDDALKPALDAYIAYGANGGDNEFYRTWSGAIDADSNTARAGVTLSVALDEALKGDRRAAARLNADALESRSKALALESTVAWQELQRNLKNLKRQAKEARELADLQRQKVEAERARFEQGRSTTFQMTTFEVDAAESELRLYRVLANLRKTENQARLFVSEESRL